MLPNVDFNTMSYERGRQLIAQPSFDKRADGIMDSITGAKDAIMQWFQDNPDATRQIKRYGIAGLGGGALGALSSLGQAKKDRTPFTRALTGAGMGMGGLGLYDLLQDARKDATVSNDAELGKLEKVEAKTDAEAGRKRWARRVGTDPVDAKGTYRPLDTPDTPQLIPSNVLRRKWPVDLGNPASSSEVGSNPSTMLGWPGLNWIGAHANDALNSGKDGYVPREGAHDLSATGIGLSTAGATALADSRMVRGRIPGFANTNAQRVKNRLFEGNTLDATAKDSFNKNVKLEKGLQSRHAKAHPTKAWIGRRVYGGPLARTITSRHSPGLTVPDNSLYQRATSKIRRPGGKMRRGGFAGAAGIAAFMAQKLRQESGPVNTNYLRDAAQQAVNMDNTAKQL